MGVVVHILVHVAVLAATANCGVEDWLEDEFTKELSIPREKLVALAVNDNKTRNYDDMLRHIKLVAEMSRPLNYTERCLLWTAYKKAIVPRIKTLNEYRYVCYIIILYSDSQNVIHPLRIVLCRLASGWTWTAHHSSAYPDWSWKRWWQLLWQYSQVDCSKLLSVGSRTSSLGDHELHPSGYVPVSVGRVHVCIVALAQMCQRGFLWSSASTARS